MTKTCGLLVLLMTISYCGFATLSVVLSTTPQSCPGENNGSITISVSNGTAPYQYTLNGLPGSSNTFSNLPPGNYNILVTDALGDTGTGTTTIWTAGFVTTVSFNVMLCPNQLPYNFNGTPISSAGVYRDTLTNMAGCDSVVALILSVTNTIEWIGSSDTSWENPLNWSCGAVPGPASTVLIHSGTVVVHANTTIYSMTIEPGATLTVTAGINLVVLH